MGKITDGSKRALFQAKQKRMFKAMDNLELARAGRRKTATPEQRINYLIKNQRAYEATITALEAEKARANELLEQAKKRGKNQTAIKLQTQVTSCTEVMKRLKKYLADNQALLESELKK